MDIGFIIVVGIIIVWGWSCYRHGIWSAECERDYDDSIEDDYEQKVRDFFLAIPKDKVIRVYKPNNTAYVKIYDTIDDCYDQSVYDGFWFVSTNNKTKMNEVIDFYTNVSENMYDFKLEYYNE